MRRFRTGWELTKKSWRLLRGQPGLTAYPIAAGVAVLAVVVLIAGPGLYLLDTDREAPAIAVLVAALYLASFVATFFGVALAAAADRAFRGERVSLGTGVSVARGLLGPIAGWALVSTVVTTLLNLLETRRDLAGPILAALGGAAWGLITFLAIPVIAFEGVGPVAAIKRSASLFRQRWRGQVTGNVGIGGAVLLFGTLPAVALMAVGFVLWTSDGNGAEIAAGMVVAAVGVALLAVSLVVAQAMRQIFGVALYRFTASDELVADFTEEELQSAVRTRGSRGGAAAPEALP